VSTPLAVAADVAALTVAGALPAWRMAGWRPVTIFLAPCTGMVLAGLAGMATVLVAAEPLRWFVPLAIAANAAALGSLVAHREQRWQHGSASGRPQGGRATVVAGALGVAAVAGAVGWCLRALIRPEIGFDARTIWLLHATWLADGHAAARHALGDPALPFAHSSYPPLAPAVVAVGWIMTGTASDRIGQVVLGIATGCTVAAAAAAVVESGVVLGVRLRARGRGVARSVVPSVLAIAAAAAWCLGAFGVAGAGATNGYVDLLWSAAAVAGAGYGLVLPVSAARMRAAAVLVAVAGLTKDEGTVAAVVLAALMTARWWRHARRARSGAGHAQPDAQRSGSGAHRGGERAGPAVAGVRPAGAWWGMAGIAALVVWPVAVRILGALPDPDRSGPRHGTLGSRADATWHAMAAHLHLAGLALAVGVAATVVLGRFRRRTGLGADAWLWVLGAVEVVAVGGFYVTGTIVIEFWLGTSVDRTTIFPQILGLAAVAWWGLVGVAAVLEPPARGGAPSVGVGPAGDRPTTGCPGAACSGTVPRRPGAMPLASPSASGLDERARSVLHPQP